MLSHLLTQTASDPTLLAIAHLHLVSFTFHSRRHQDNMASVGEKLADTSEFADDHLINPSMDVGARSITTRRILLKLDLK